MGFSFDATIYKKLNSVKYKLAYRSQVHLKGHIFVSPYCIELTSVLVNFIIIEPFEGSNNGC